MKIVRVCYVGLVISLMNLLLLNEFTIIVKLTVILSDNEVLPRRVIKL